MLTNIRQHFMQMLLIFAAFFLFLTNVMGWVSIDPALGLSGIRFGSEDIMTLNGLTSPPILPVVRTTEFFIFVSTGLLLTFLLPILNPIKASLLTFATTLPVAWLFVSGNWSGQVLPMEYVLIMILVLFGINVLTGYFSETHNKQQILELFGQYVPPEVVTQMSQNPEKFSQSGEARELTIMFADIHHFTTISEHLSPEQLTGFLNEVLTVLTEIIYRNHGTVDKYIGDAVMAFWGAPLDDPDHAQHAVNAAFEIQRHLIELRKQFKKRNLPEIKMGIGISTGMTSVGNMGSRYRMAYTAVGDAVNLASRLEGLTRNYYTPVLISEQTRRQTRDIACREIDLVQVKGKEMETRIYEPLCPLHEVDDTLQSNLESHSQALQAYYRQDWETAQAAFESLQDSHPGIRLYSVFLQRITSLREQPLAENWNGATSYSS